MPSKDIFLILISGLGVFHGLFLAIFLWFYAHGSRLSNRILSILLLVLSFRVGKSILLEFAAQLDIQIIFIGLAALMAIGPLFYLYTSSVIDHNFRLRANHSLHFIFPVLGLFFGLWINQELAQSIPNTTFLLIFIFYYGHYLLYLFASFRSIKRAKALGLDDESKSLLTLLFYTLLAVWLTYVLNLFDDLIPYIYGPILYTIAVYSASYILIRKGYIKAVNHVKYKTTPVSEAQIDQVFSRVLRLIEDEKQFKNSNLTLKSLSKQVGVSSQTLSLAVNKRSNSNFNEFINSYRIEEAINIFKDSHYNHHTIASVAFEVGFGSISSFNSNFKKHTNITPKAYRKKLQNDHI